MIFHGLDRPTEDSDIWLDPAGGIEVWSETLRNLRAGFPTTYFWDLGHRTRCPESEIPAFADAFGVIRIGGLSEPLDVFYRPNNLTEEMFDQAWTISAELPLERARVLSSPDLLATKAGSERERDMTDLAFLEAKIRREFSERLRSCSLDDAQALFARYADHETCRAALANPAESVRALSIATLRELATGQNPFARELLDKLDEQAD
jgi:hypothetical protein